MVPALHWLASSLSSLTCSASCTATPPQRSHGQLPSSWPCCLPAKACTTVSISQSINHSVVYFFCSKSARLARARAHARTHARTHTHTHTFNGPLSGTTQVSRYQKGKTNLDFTEARYSEWQWHPLCHMQVCTSLQTDNHTSTHCSVFYRPDALPAAQPTDRQTDRQTDASQTASRSVQLVLWNSWLCPTDRQTHKQTHRHTERDTQTDRSWNRPHL